MTTRAAPALPAQSAVTEHRRSRVHLRDRYYFRTGEQKQAPRWSAYVGPWSGPTTGWSVRTATARLQCGSHGAGSPQRKRPGWSSLLFLRGESGCGRVRPVLTRRGVCTRPDPSPPSDVAATRTDPARRRRAPGRRRLFGPAGSLPPCHRAADDGRGSVGADSPCSDPMRCEVPRPSGVQETRIVSPAGRGRTRQGASHHA